MRLRAIETQDYSLLNAWLNDAELMLYWGHPGYTPSLRETARLEDAQAARDNSAKYIIETLEGESIGQIDYYDLSWRNRSTWVSIMVGKRDYWGGGFGTEAMKLLLGYLFDQLGLHRVTLTVHASNTRAQRSYEKVGFVSEGVYREWAFFNGQWVDGLVMSVLDREFRERA